LESGQSERIRIDARLPPVVLPSRLLNELYLHARESYPEECCGLLTGSGPDSYVESHRCRNEMTKHHRNDPAAYPRNGSEAFHMSEIDYLEVVRRAEGAGQQVTGVYHSHVDAGAYFSELDQDFASQPLFPFPGAVHFVVSIIDREIRGLGAFRWLQSEARFEGRAVRAEAR
jgi:proteasome lid subunit RPN8/RPN11